MYEARRDGTAKETGRRWGNSSSSGAGGSNTGGGSNSVTCRLMQCGRTGRSSSAGVGSSSAGVGNSNAGVGSNNCGGGSSSGVRGRLLELAVLKQQCLRGGAHRRGSIGGHVLLYG